MATPNHPARERTVIIQDPALKTFEGGFTSIPNRILENPDLTLGARMTYAMLLKYAWQDNFCFPAQESVARDLGVTDRSVRTFLTELRDHRLIDWKQRGLNRPNIYYLKRLPARPKRDGARPGPENISAPGRKPASGQERNQASDYEDSRTKTHDVDVEHPSEGRELRPMRESLPRLVRPATPSAVPPTAAAKVAYLVDTLAEQLGDRKLRSRHTFRRLVEALGEDLVWQVLGNVREAARDGVIAGNKAAYFVGVAKQVARERGIDLGLKSSRLAA